MSEVVEQKIWKTLSDLIETNDSAALELYTDSISSSEMVHALFKLSAQEQQKLFACLSPLKAAELIEELPESYAADVLEEIQPQQAASIFSEMASDDRVNILQKFDEDDAEEILNLMDEEDAEETRSLIDYEPNVAGGLMMTEYLSYPKSMLVSEVVKDLTERSDDYALYNVQYIYVVHKKHKLMGVVRLRDLVFSEPNKKLADIAIKAITVLDESSLDEM